MTRFIERRPVAPLLIFIAAIFVPWLAVAPWPNGFETMFGTNEVFLDALVKSITLGGLYFLVASVMAVAFARPRYLMSAGGSGGVALATRSMRRLPVGLPELMISTVASGNASEYVGGSDNMRLYSVTDVHGQPGKPFHDPAADQALFAALERNCASERQAAARSLAPHHQRSRFRRSARFRLHLDTGMRTARRRLAR